MILLCLLGLFPVALGHLDEPQETYWVIMGKRVNSVCPVSQYYTVYEQPSIGCIQEVVVIYRFYCTCIYPRCTLQIPLTTTRGHTNGYSKGWLKLYNTHRTNVIFPIHMGIYTQSHKSNLGIRPGKANWDIAFHPSGWWNIYKDKISLVWDENIQWWKGNLAIAYLPKFYSQWYDSYGNQI